MLDDAWVCRITFRLGPDLPLEVRKYGLEFSSYTLNGERMYRLDNQKQKDKKNSETPLVEIWARLEIWLESLQK